MSTTKRNGSELTAKAASDLSRRFYLKAAVSSGVAAALGPAIVRDAFASSGELNILTWPDENPPALIAEFTKKTGIKVNLTPYGQNEEMVNKLQATGGEGFDLCMPSRPWAPQMRELELLTNWDTNKIALDNLSPEMLALSTSFWTWDGKLFHLPHAWGSEAISWRTDLTTVTYKDASYGMLWDEKYRGKVQGRPWSMLLQIGLWWDYTGRLKSDRMYNTFKDPDKFKAVYDQILAFAVKNKAQVKQFWDNSDSAISGYMENGCVIGETWDGPALRLKKQGKPIGYVAPQEGAMTFMDGWAILKTARNVSQAYEYIKFLYTPEGNALMSNSSGYNPVVRGADAFLTAEQRRCYEDAYPEDALKKLWVQVPAQPWYLQLRSQYADKFKSA